MVSSATDGGALPAPQLSVVIPVFRTEHFLQQCLEDVSASSLTALEIIVVDDGPSARCRRIVEARQRQDSRVRYVRHSDNRGLFEARRSGVEAALAPYVAFLDPDDRLEPDIYETACRVAAEEDACVVLFNARLRDGAGREWTEDYNTLPAFRQHTGEQLLERIFSRHTTAWAWHVNWNRVVKRSLLLAAYGQLGDRRHLVMYEDLLLSCALYLQVLHKPCITAVDDVGITYLLHDASATKDSTYASRLKRSEDALCVLESVARLLRRHRLMATFEGDFASTRRLLLSRFRPPRPASFDLKAWWRHLGLKWRHRALSVGAGTLIDADLSPDQAQRIILDSLGQSEISGRIAIYGTGVLGQQLYRSLVGQRHAICCFVTSSAKEGERIDGIPVLCPETALRDGADTFVIASVGSCLQIRELLEAESERAGRSIRIFGIG